MTEALVRLQPSVEVYTPEAVAACEKALRTLLAKIGPWGTRIVLVGGLVPRYLVRAVPEGVNPHVGTTDLDVVIGVALTADDEETYRTLQANLAEARFHPAKNERGEDVSFRWQRDDVDGIIVTVEFFCPVGEGEPGHLRKRPVEAAGAKISAIRLAGAELAGGDFVTVPLPGEVLDQGGRREDVTVRVANILPFVALKSLALAEREKDKDAYDLVWTLSAFDGGPTGAAIAARASPVRDQPLIASAIRRLGEHFGTVESVGPARYARFFLGVTRDIDGRDRLRRDAHAAVHLFLAAWNSA